MVKGFITLAHGGKLKYFGNCHGNLTLENVSVTVIYHGIFIIFALGVKFINNL
jgi:hypothetical protein